MKVSLGCDHGGYALKEEIKKHLEEKGIEYVDCGTYSTDSVDYPDFAKAACEKVQSGECDFALLYCSTGIGISIAANKMKGIRCCVCSDTYSAKYTRMHNNANALAMGGKVVGAGLAAQITDIFLSTEFEGGRHQRRMTKSQPLKKTDNRRNICIKRQLYLKKARDALLKPAGFGFLITK